MSTASRRAGRTALALLSALALTAFGADDASGPRIRADGWHAQEFGQAQGYPVGKPAEREQPQFLVGAYSRGDVLLRHHDIATAKPTAPLEREAKEPSIHYRWNRGYYSLGDYLDGSPVTGLLIARAGRILVERYQYDRRDTDAFTSQSMAKTIVGLLVGIAVAEGKIRSIADTAETYAPGLRGTELGRTPIKALLQMASGIAFEHAFGDDSAIGDLAKLNRGPGGAEGLRQFNRRIAPPGARFNYSAADNRTLGLVLVGATGKTVSAYAQEKIWKPLGAEAAATWQVDGTGQEITSCCFAARLRDWARLGLMLADDGQWRGKQVVPRDWILAATTVAPDDSRTGTPRDGYGYQVWLLPNAGRMFVLRGLRGQAVFVDPKTKTVMVHTAVMGMHHVDTSTALWNGVLESLP